VPDRCSGPVPLRIPYLGPPGVRRARGWKQRAEDRFAGAMRNAVRMATKPDGRVPVNASRRLVDAVGRGELQPARAVGCEP
jgi:hypothetical protein